MLLSYHYVFHALKIQLKVGKVLTHYLDMAVLYKPYLQCQVQQSECTGVILNFEQILGTYPLSKRFSVFQNLEKSKMYNTSGAKHCE